MISVEPTLIVSYLREHPRLVPKRTGSESERTRTEMIEGLNSQVERNDPTLEESLNQLAPDEIQEILDIIGKQIPNLFFVRNLAYDFVEILKTTS